MPGMFPKKDKGFLQQYQIDRNAKRGTSVPLFAKHSELPATNYEEGKSTLLIT